MDCRRSPGRSHGEGASIWERAGEAGTRATVRNYQASQAARGIIKPNIGAVKTKDLKSGEGATSPCLRRSTDSGAGVGHEIRAAGGAGDKGNRDGQGSPVHTLTFQKVEERCDQGTPSTEDEERDLVPGGAGDRARNIRKSFSGRGY